MSFKYQLLACPRPEDIILVTLNHLDSLKNLVAESHTCCDMIHIACRKLNEVIIICTTCIYVYCCDGLLYNVYVFMYGHTVHLMNRLMTLCIYMYLYCFDLHSLVCTCMFTMCVSVCVCTCVHFDIMCSTTAHCQRQHSLLWGPLCWLSFKTHTRGYIYTIRHITYNPLHLLVVCVRVIPLPNLNTK